MQRRDGAAQSGGREARGRLPAPGGGRGVGRQDQLPGERWRSSRSLAESESHTHTQEHKVSRKPSGFLAVVNDQLEREVCFCSCVLGSPEPRELKATFISCFHTARTRAYWMYWKKSCSGQVPLCYRVGARPHFGLRVVV